MLFPRPVWNFALLEARDSPLDICSAKLLRLWSSRKLRKTADAIHTQADPFLWVDGDWLYVFIEVQRIGQPGHIEAHRTRDLLRFEALGPVLTEPHHLSYPQVFRSERGVHLVPESSAADEVVLYTFDSFPAGLKKERVLLHGPYHDPTLFRHKGLWWMFATRGASLELFVTADLAEPFHAHPMNPLTDHPARARCGGPVLEWQGDLYRLAQDGTERYGGNLAAFRITRLDRDVYEEVLAIPSIFDRDAPWRSQGAHHLSAATFQGRTIIAVDGKQYDLLVNRPLALAFALIR